MNRDPSTRQKHSGDFGHFLIKQPRLQIVQLLLATMLVLSSSSRVFAQAAGNVSFSDTTLKTIIIDDYSPYTFVNANGQPDGFSVDLMEAVAQVMGFNLEIKVDTWDNARHALENGEIDFLPMMAYSEERDKLYDFSPPHMIAFDAFFSRKDSAAIRSMDDLQGKNVIVMESDQAHDYLLSLVSIKAEQLILVNSLPEALRLLASGKGDTALMPKLVGLALIRDLKLTNLEPSPVVVEAYNRPFSFAVNDGNQAILERLNQGMSIVKATGQYDEIYNNWFGTLEMHRMTLKEFLKVFGVLLLVFVLIGGVLLLWSFSLKRQVTARTKSMEAEIQERILAESALIQANERLALAQRSAGAGIWDWDMVTGKLNWSTELFHLFGLDPAKTDATFDAWGGILHPEDSQAAGERINEAIRDHQPLLNEYRIITPSSETRWINVWGNTIYNEHGEAQRMSGICIDISERKQAEEILRQSEDKYRRLFEDAAIGIFHSTFEGRFISVNPALAKMLGYDSPEEVVDSIQNISEQVYVDPPQRTKIITDALTRGEAVIAENRYRRKDGTIWTGNLILRHVMDANSKAQYLEGFVKDITERKRAEEALRESEINLSTLIENIDGSIWAVDSHYSLIVGNEEFHRNTSAVLGRRLKKNESVLPVSFPSEVNAEWQGYYDRTLHGESFDIEILTHFRSTPYLIEYRFSPIRTAAGEIHGVTVYGRDITERKRAEDSLRHYLSELKVLYENGLATSTLQEPREIGRKTMETLLDNLSWHHVAIRLRRGETDELELIAFHQPNLDEQNTVEEEKRLATLVSKVGQGLSGWSVETGHAIRTGNVHEYLQYVETYPGIRSGMYMPLIVGSFARVIGCIAVESDRENAFTEQDERLLATLAAQTAIAFENARLYQNVQQELHERMRAEEEVRQLNASLEQRVEERTQELSDAQEQLVRKEKLAVLGQLAGSVGHELRNPLGVISNAVFFLKTAQPDADEKVKEYLHIIEREIGISDKIVADLLDFTRIKYAEREAVSISELIHQTLERFSAPKSIQVTLDLPADLPQVYTDPQHLTQILGNLAINAYQAMSKGGELRISSRAQPVHDMIAIIVQDAGSGISPENMKKLFEPLFTTKPKGIGLGLAVSRKLVEANGGRIEVQSEAGKGSTFTVYLPIKQNGRVS